MDSITGLLEGFDLAKLLPKIGQLISSVRFWTVLLMYAGPLTLLGLGLWYYLRPELEPTTKRGFRIPRALQSKEAWQFTQKFAGVLWTALGGALAAISIVISLFCLGASTIGLVTTAVVWVLIQAILAGGAYGLVWLTVQRRYGEKKK